MAVTTATPAGRAAAEKPIAANAAANARAQSKYNRDTPPISISDARAEPEESQLFRKDAPAPAKPAFELENMSGLPREPTPAAQPAKDVSICIEAGPDGLRVRLDYVGTLASIPAALERLRAAGVLDLVSAARTAPPNAPPPPTPAAKKPTKRAQPAYDADGDPICPVHGKPLQEGNYGLYCPSKAEGEYANQKGYCNLKFEA